MAQRKVVQLIDDLDGSLIDQGGQTVAFAYRGAEYEIDLGEENAVKLAEALEPFVQAARKVGGPKRVRAPATPIDGSQLAVMRRWAKQHGYTVSDRGRVSREVQEAYHAAH